jgi:hypothetical protein
MKMATDEARVPDYILEQYALGELPAREMEELGRRLKTDVELAARLKQLHESSEAILREHPPERFAAAVARRCTPASGSQPGRNGRRRHLPRWFLLAPAVAAAAALLIILIVPHSPSPPGLSGTSPSGTVRPKGLQLQMRIYRQSPGGVERLSAGAEVCNHDVLQISYIAATRPYGTIVSIDGRGAVTLHFPDSVSGATDLDQDGEIPLPHAYEIDDAPDFERFFMVTASTPVAVAEVMRAARNLARSRERAREQMLDLPEGFEQTSIIVRKREISL